MAIHYASIGYTSDPDNQQIIPVGGNHPLKFPRNEQHDPWEMHPATGPVIRMAATGMATFQLDVSWAPGSYARRYGIISDTWPYEGTADGVRPDHTYTFHTPVHRGDDVAVLVGHAAATPQNVVSARLQVMIDDDVAIPVERKINIRVGTDPDPDETDPPPVYGDGIAQTPIDPEHPGH